jgi:hypothetical protein
MRLKVAIESVLLDSFHLPSIQAAEQAETLEGPVRDLIVKHMESTPFPKLIMITSAEHIVAGYCYVDPTDSPEIAAAKRSRLNIEPLLEEIRGLNFQEFERFGACVLRELGANSPKVTPHSEDQGIDFYGILSLGQNSFLPPPFGQLAHDVRLRFAGQAKHYPTRSIGPELMRELVGAISLARHKIFTVDAELFDALELLPFNPLVAMFFTTGRFTAGTLELAARSGIIAKSGEELALFLADRGIGMYEDGGTMKFDRARFREWLSS